MLIRCPANQPCHLTTVPLYGDHACSSGRSDKTFFKVCKEHCALAEDDIKFDCKEHWT